MTSKVLFIAISLTVSSVFADTKKPEIRIVSLESEFKSFWLQAKGQSFEQQLALWNQIIEKPNQDLYNQVVWQTLGPVEYWSERKIRLLKGAFQSYPELFPKALKKFQEFSGPNGLLVKQAERFKKLFPDAHFSEVFYVIPDIGSAGKSSKYFDRYGKQHHAMVFGADMIAQTSGEEFSPSANILASLFSLYWDQKKAAIESREQEDELAFNLLRWGLAYQVASFWCPESNWTILGNKEFEKLTPKDTAWLAGEYLKLIEKSNPSTLDRQIWRTWYGDKTPVAERPRPDMPSRSGMYLGFQVARELFKSSKDIQGVFKWKPSEVHSKVIETLKKLEKKG